MRVAFLTHEPFCPPSGGGSAEAMYLVRELVRRGHQVHLFCPRLEDAERVRQEFGIRIDEFTTWEMGRYTSLRSLKYVAYPAFLTRMVVRSSKKTPFDLVFSQHAISAVAAGRIKRRLKIPAVMNFLDYLTGFMETWPRYLAPRPLLRTLERYELALPMKYDADAVLTVSDTLADHFEQAGYPRNRLRPIYFGFDADSFRPVEGGKAAGHEKPVVIMHGSFDHHHLGPIALDGLRRVAEGSPDSTLRFVGRQTGPLRRFCARLRSLAPRANIECAGFVPYYGVPEELVRATVGIVPYEESTGTHCAFVAKIVEYLAMELPVVSTPMDSAKRYFGGEPAVRFSGFNGESFAREILGWLRESEDKRLEAGRVASRRVRLQLSWNAIAKNAIDFAEKILQTTSP